MNVQEIHQWCICPAPIGRVFCLFVYLMYQVRVVLFVMLFSFVFTNKKLTKEISSNVSGFVTKVDSVVSVPFTALSKSHNVISDLLSTYNENQDLKKSLSNLENQSSIISNLQEENDSLRASLNLSDKLSRDTVLTAEVSMRPSVTWLKELTINVGKSKNVSKSMLATSNGGVIGFVTKVYDDTTTISLLSSSSSDSYLASSVKSEDDNQIFGIISRYDKKKKLLEMTQLNSSSNVKVGTEVVTSGLDDVSVKDVPIGTVDSVSDYEGNRTILVKPYADFDKISYVTLVGDGK